MIIMSTDKVKKELEPNTKAQDMMDKVMNYDTSKLTTLLSEMKKVEDDPEAETEKYMIDEDGNKIYYILTDGSSDNKNKK